MEAITALFCDIWTHLSTYKERYIIIALVFAIRPIFKWFIQSWAIRMEYEITTMTFIPKSYRPKIQFKFRTGSTPSETGVETARNIILSDLSSRQFFALLRVQRSLWKEKKRQARRSRGNQ